MPTANQPLLLRFRSQDTAIGLTRSTLRALARELGQSETNVIHLALARLVAQLSHAYEPDDGPLSSRKIAAVRRRASQLLPTDALLSKQSLF
jgi:uncharacterized protein (DUF2267 family)